MHSSSKQGWPLYVESRRYAQRFFFWNLYLEPNLEKFNFICLAEWMLERKMTFQKSLWKNSLRHQKEKTFSKSLTEKDLWAIKPVSSWKNNFYCFRYITPLDQIQQLITIDDCSDALLSSISWLDTHFFVMAKFSSQAFKIEYSKASLAGIAF